MTELLKETKLQLGQVLLSRNLITEEQIHECCDIIEKVILSMK